MAKTITQLPDATVVNGSDELIIQQSGVTKRATKTEVLNGIVNANVDAAAAIAGSKLADASITPSKLSQPYTQATSQNSTSGTSIAFTGIPSWAKRITASFNMVSTNGSSVVQVQLGTSGGYDTSNYNSTCGALEGSALVKGPQYFSTGFGMQDAGAAAQSHTGNMVICNVAGNTWVASYVGYGSGSPARVHMGGGSVVLSSTLDRLRVTTVNGTDAFDLGQVNISYEG